MLNALASSSDTLPLAKFSTRKPDNVLSLAFICNVPLKFKLPWMSSISYWMSSDNDEIELESADVYFSLFELMSSAYAEIDSA